MSFNYATGQYEPDQPQQVQPSMNDWYRLAGFGQGADPNLNYGSQAGASGGGNPGLLNGGVVDPVTGQPTQGVNLGNNQPPPQGYPNPGDDPAWRQAHSGMPNPTTPLPMGTVSNGTNRPGGVDFSSPTVVPSLMGQQAPQSPLQIFSQNNGMDPNKSPLDGDFWSNTAGHWVDPKYGTDATGRVLSDAEKTYWQGYDHARASGTLDSYLKNVTNPGLAAGTQATYAPGVATTTIPGRTLDQTGAPAAAANPAAAGPAAAATQFNPLDPAWDYSKAGAVPWQAFVKNLFADANANQSFKELQGVLTPEQVNAAAVQFGWQPMQGSSNPDANAVFRAGIQAATADPASDYSVVRMQGADGTLSFGLMKRAQSTATQEAGGFYAPGSTSPNSPANQARAAAARAATQRATNYSRGGSGTTARGGGGSAAPTGPTQKQAQQTIAGAGGAALKFALAHMPPAPPPPATPAQPQGAQGQLPPGQTNAPYRPNPGTGVPGVALYPGADLGGQAGPGVPKPAPYGNPPEGAVRVNPDDSRSVWHNGQWVDVPGFNHS